MKWYIKLLRAEEDETSVICLTDAEYNAVRKFLEEAEYVSGGGYCGSCNIFSIGFATKEEAIAVAHAADSTSSFLWC